MRAYGAWVRGEFDLAVSLAEETRRLEAALSVTPTGLAERVLGNVLYIIDRSDLGNIEAARQIELAEASGNDSRLVHACYMGAVALSSEGRHDEAAHLVERAREKRRRPVAPRISRRRRSPKDSRVGPSRTRSKRSSGPIASPAPRGTVG